MKKNLTLILAIIAVIGAWLPHVIVRASYTAPVQTSLQNTYANIVATTCNGANTGQLAILTDSVYSSARCDGSGWVYNFRGQKAVPPTVTGQTTTLSGAHNNSTTTFTVTANFSSMPSTPFYIMVGTEQVKVTGVSSTTWTVARGDGGTTAASHSDLDAITEMLYSWAHFTANSSYSNSGGSLIIENSASADTNDVGVKMKVKLAYSAPWTVKAIIGGHYPQIKNYQSYGLALWDVASPTKDVRQIINFVNNTFYGPFDIYSWTSGGFAAAISGGTPNTTYAGSSIAIERPFTAQAPAYVKLVDDNTNWIFYVADEGGVYRETGRVAHNTTITATHVGPFASARSARAGVVLLSLEQFNSAI